MTENRSKGEVKAFDQKNFTLIASLIEKGEYPLHIEGLSKQALNWHIRKFEAAGLIRKTTRHVYQEYELCEASKGFLIGHDKSSLMRLHHAELHFKVVSWGTFPRECQSNISTNLINNSYFHRDFLGLKFRFFPASDTFEVYGPEIYANSEAEAYGKMTMQVMNAVNYMVSKYDMQVSGMTLARKPHIALINNPFTQSLVSYCKAAGVSPQLGDFWVDESFGKPEFETSTIGKAQQFIDNVMELPKVYDRISEVERQLGEKLLNALEMIAKLTWGLDKITKFIDDRFGGGK